jgi:hypothetical protein
MNTRRRFLQGSAGGTLAALGVLADSGSAVATESADAGAQIGSLYPFVKSQVVAGEFPLSFLQKEFTDAATWKPRARQKLLDLLHYAPPRCDPRAQVVARVDRGDYFEERIAFNTTPDIRVPAFVLDRRASESEQLVARSVEAAGFTWPGVMFWDDIRTLDYLAARPEVDASRLGCVGSLAMPRPLLVINGSRDALFEPAGVRAAFEKLAACYGKAGAAEKVQTRLYDTPHEFNLEMQREAWAFLETHLRRAA